MDLSLKQLSFAYHAKKPVLQQVDTILTSGQLTALLGVNGSGKSTLIKLMAGILKPDQGQIVLGAPANRPLSSLGPRQIAHHCAYVAQNTQPPALTVFDYVLLGRLPHQSGWTSKPMPADLKLVEESLAQMELTPLAFRPMGELSGGQVQMAVIARALAQQAPILLLDEPTNNLDPSHQLRLMKKLHAISRQRHTTVIYSMHDVNLALHWADQVVLLHEGRVLRHIATEKLTAADLSTLFGLSYRMHTAQNMTKNTAVNSAAEVQRWFWPDVC
ncbi:MAG: ABC transporter ATP-binding protein [Desulfuromonadaceae bacterium]|nr:ABC transporter ATP-binding protein [Desulfuromonadaceae bacterium]